MITIGVVDKHVVVRDAIVALLEQNSEFNPIALDVDPVVVVDKIKQEGINIVLINIHDLDNVSFSLIKHITQRYERVRVLVFSHSDSEAIIVKSIKSGAKGFLAGDAGRNELFEAIYTLRNGFDFYSKSIAHLLLGKYINGMLMEKSSQAPGIEALSSRQIEILKLWGANKSNKEIADELYLSVRTVESHKNHIMQKLNLKTTVDMIKFGIRNNLIEL